MSHHLSHCSMRTADTTMVVGNRTVDHVEVYPGNDDALPSQRSLDSCIARLDRNRSSSSSCYCCSCASSRSSSTHKGITTMRGLYLIVFLSWMAPLAASTTSPSSPNLRASPIWRGLQSALSTYSRPKGLVKSTTPWFPSSSSPSSVGAASPPDESDSSSELDNLKSIEYPLAVHPRSAGQSSDAPFTLSRLQVAQHAYLQRFEEEGNEEASVVIDDDDELSFLESEGQRRQRLQFGVPGYVTSCGAAAAAWSVRQKNTRRSSKSRRQQQPPSKQRSESPMTVTPTSATTSSEMAAAATHRPLVFWENMIAGAISRSIAQTIMHPANTLKTMLQTNRGVSSLELLRPQNFRRLTWGAGTNFLLSVPHGAVNFAVLELVRTQLSLLVEHTPALSDRADSIGPGLDFVSSAISTITCSVVSTPQMVLADNIMAGNYPNLVQAVRGLAQQRGLRAFYTGWWPGLVGKIPSYALTWTFFQQLKELRDKWTGRPATDLENTIMGCIASGTTVCIMIPLDTIKTRLVTQSAAAHLANGQAYKGIIDCGIRIVREEGVQALYRGLTPRLVSVVPMIGIQFGVYEFMRKAMVERSTTTPKMMFPALPKFGLDVKIGSANNGKARPLMATKNDKISTKITMKTKSESRNDDLASPSYGAWGALQEAAMEVAASPEVPFPAPRFLQRMKTSQILLKKPKKTNKQNERAT